MPKPAEPTLEDRAAAALATLATTMPTRDEILAGDALPEWMTAKWLRPLTDPADKKFPQAVAEAEAWLANR